MIFETIRYQIESGIATITLNRPEKLNCFTLQMLKELEIVFESARTDPSVSCLIITGAGKGFCAGQDLESFSASPNDDLVRKYYIPLILRIRNMEKPVLAAVNGIAAGVGCSMVLACDLVILSDKASLLQAFIKVGLVPDSGASYFLPRLIGYHRAMELALFGDVIKAEQAFQLGLCNRVVPNTEFQAVVSEWASRLANGPKSMGWTKRVIAEGFQRSLEETMQTEIVYLDKAADTADYKEALSAFLEKRKPKFIGK